MAAAVSVGDVKLVEGHGGAPGHMVGPASSRGGNQGGRALVTSGDYSALAGKLDALLQLHGDSNGAAGVEDDVPLIQAAAGASIDARIQPVESHPIHYLDQCSYPCQYSEWVEWLGRMEDLLEQGKHHVHMLYSFRSVSKAIPLVNSQQQQQHLLQQQQGGQQSAPADGAAVPPAPSSSTAASTTTSSLYRETFVLLKPEILKIQDLMLFVDTLKTSFIQIMKLLLSKKDGGGWRALPVPDSVFMAMVRLVDLLQRLDNLKDVKASLNNDFARFKRAFQAIKGDLTDNDEVAEMIHQINLFLASPLYAKSLIFHSFRADVKKAVQGYEDIVLHMLALTQDSLAREQYLVPEEKYQLLRALPHLLWLIDGDYQLKKGGAMPEPSAVTGGGNTNTKPLEPINVFKHRGIRLGPLQEIFRRYPVVPEFADMTLSLGHALKEAPHYDPDSMDRAWGRSSNGGGGDDAKVAKLYDLRTSEWRVMKGQYDHYIAKLTFVVNNVRAATGANTTTLSQSKRESLAADGKLVYDTVLEGLRYLQRWGSSFLELLAWKTTHPCPIDVAEKAGGKKTTPGFEYECVGKYNYSKAELSVIVDVIRMCKSLASTMSRAEPTLAPIIRLYIHNRVQLAVQGTLVPVLHRVFKWKRPLLTPLLELRNFVADWKNGNAPVDDYKRYRRAQGPVKAEPPNRVVTNSMTQLQLLRCTLKTIMCQAKVSGGGASCLGMGGKRDMVPEEMSVLSALFEESHWYPYLLDYRACVEASADFSALWFREFYLELTRQIQFPIEMSLPWILTEHVIQHQTVEVPLLEATLHLLDVYNDAAHKSLYVLKKQFLYDELEAEVNLVFDQFTYLVAEDVYAYYKNYAASAVLDKVYKKRLDNTRGGNWLQQPRRRFHIPLGQRHVKLLGRTVDLNAIVADTINDRITSDIDLAIKRFESQDPCGVLDLELALSVLRMTHSLLAEHAPSLRAFDSMLHDVNNEGTGGSGGVGKGRISLHVLDSLVSDLLPNFSYNMYTARFTKSPLVGRKMAYNAAPKGNPSHKLMGELCYKAFEHQAKLWRGYFGREHLCALQRLLGPALGQILQELMTYLEERVFFLRVYISALLPGIPPIKLPKFIFKSGGVYGAFETLLTPLLEYDDLKPEVFQLLREVGNALAFFKETSDAMDIADILQLIQTAPFLGVKHTSFPVQGFAQQPVPECPLLRQSKAWHEALKRDLHYASRVKVSEPVSSFLADLQRWACLGGGSAQTKSLFRLVLRRFDDFITTQGMKSEWCGGGAEPENGVLEVEASREFHRFWSAMAFLYSCEAQKRGREDLPPDDEEFGHGFTLAGAVLVYLLGQKERFYLLDFSQHVLKVQEYEQQSAAPGGDSKVGMVAVSLQQAAKSFLTRAARQSRLMSEVFALMERTYPIGPPAELLVFHPPKTL